MNVEHRNRGPAVRLRREDLDARIRALMAQAGDDRDRPDRSPLDPINMRDLRVPGRGASRIFRILLTNACRFDCLYCPMRRGRAMARHALEPERLVSAFLTAWRRGWADSLFVTTAIPGDPVRTADRLLHLVESLRLRHGYRGYLHVKIVPGAEEGQVRRLSRFCDRVSYNLEFACGRSFRDLAPEKSAEEGMRVLRIARSVREEGRRRRREGEPADPARPECRSGATTQFVVGAGEESDGRLLEAAARLESRGMVHHVHFAAFRPIRDTPLEDRAETPSLREARLYQAEHLMRGYGFALEEIPLDGGRLPLEVDPKTAWAERHPERFPVEVTAAGFHELLRVPGVGPVSARRLVEGRRRLNLRGIEDLRSLGISSRAAPWLTMRGRLLGHRPGRQLRLPWGAGPDAPRRSYEVSPGTFR